MISLNVKIEGLEVYNADHTALVERFQSLSREEARAEIARLETRLLEEPQVDFELKHEFGNGTYVRSMYIPKGVMLTGKIHKESHVNMVSKGDITVVTEDGVARYKAPFSFVSGVGTKRLGYAHEDTIWTTVHATSETDLALLEQLITAESFEEIEVLCNKVED